MNRHAVHALFAVALSSCGGASASQPAPLNATSPKLTPAIAQRHHSAAAGILLPAHSLRSTWISSAAKREKSLLFISDDVYNSVDLYSVPKLKLEGSIAGFKEPQGMCTDSHGDVWVTNTSTQQIFLLTRGGRIHRALTDLQGYPVGCAIDPNSGDLAVTNIEGVTTSGIGSGDVLVYPHAHGTPTEYTCPNLYYYYFDGYDENGNILIDGVDGGSAFALCGGSTSSLAAIALGGGTIYFPGAVQWSHRYQYWDVFDQNCAGQDASCAYWVTVSGGDGAITGTTAITNYEGAPVCDLVQGIIDEKSRHIFGGDYESCGSAESSIDRWQNPAGGSPSDVNHDASYVGEPIGSALSTR